MADFRARLNLLTEKGLADPEPEPTPDLYIPSELLPNTLRDPILSAKTREILDYPQLFSELQELIKKAEPRYREFIATNAWRCNFVHLHLKPAKRCNTINGHIKNQKPQARKNCSRCKNPRKNERTLMEELHEIDFFGLNPKEEEKPVPVEENDDY